MTVLFKYLLNRNLFLLFIILFLSTCIYVLTDLFERVDDFIDSDISIWNISLYFLVKIPSIISQLFPAIFFISIILQLNLLQKSRELTALQAGGISFNALIKFVIIYGLFWSFGQILFSQIIGVEGDKIAAAIWKRDVKMLNEEETLDSINKLWVNDKNRLIFIKHALPDKNIGSSLHLYELDSDKNEISSIIMADNFNIEPKRWILNNATVVSPSLSVSEHFESLDLPIKQDLKVFLSIDPKAQPDSMSIIELYTSTKKLKKAGSNVEKLETIFHSKIAYAFSIILLGLFALIITWITANIYKAIGSGLCVIFLFYCSNSIGISMGEAGTVLPIVAAWATDVIMGILALGMFLVPTLYKWLQSKKTIRCLD